MWYRVCVSLGDAPALLAAGAELAPHPPYTGVSRWCVLLRHPHAAVRPTEDFRGCWYTGMAYHGAVVRL